MRGRTASLEAAKKPEKVLIKGYMISEKLVGVKSSFIGNDGQVCSVESIAIQYYNHLGWNAMVLTNPPNFWKTSDTKTNS